MNNITTFASKSLTLQEPVAKSVNANRFKIECIIRHFTNNGTSRTRYCIRWKGWRYEYNSWQNEEDVNIHAVKKY